MTFRLRRLGQSTGPAPRPPRPPIWAPTCSTPPAPASGSAIPVLPASPHAWMCGENVATLAAQHGRGPDPVTVEMAYARTPLEREVFPRRWRSWRDPTQRGDHPGPRTSHHHPAGNTPSAARTDPTIGWTRYAVARFAWFPPSQSSAPLRGTPRRRDHRRRQPSAPWNWCLRRTTRTTRHRPALRPGMNSPVQDIPTSIGTEAGDGRPWTVFCFTRATQRVRLSGIGRFCGGCTEPCGIAIGTLLPGVMNGLEVETSSDLATSATPCSHPGEGTSRLARHPLRGRQRPGAVRIRGARC